MQSQARLRRKLLADKIRQSKDIKTFRISSIIDKKPAESVKKSLTLQDRLSRSFPPETRLSPWSGKQLKQYIWKDFECLPPHVQLLEQIHSKGTAKHRFAPIDYCYFDKQHLKQVNEMLSREFWPGIDVSDQLRIPDSSIVATYKKIVVGCAFMTSDCYISYIMVKPGWQGAGIAKFMLYFLVEVAGTRDVVLHVSANNSAMILYQSFGFKPEEFIVNFYEKYLEPDSRQCKNAFFIRLRK